MGMKCEILFHTLVGKATKAFNLLVSSLTVQVRFFTHKMHPYDLDGKAT